MTKMAILSDPHANIWALKNVLADARRRGAGRIICLGDIAGYGPKPVECWTLLQSACADSDRLRGNHDDCAADPVNRLDDRTNPAAAAAILWSHERLRDAGLITDMESRPFVLREGKLLFVHGSPLDPLNQYIFPFTTLDTDKMRKLFAAIGWVAFVGHTHMPAIFTEENGVYRVEEQSALGEEPQVLDPNNKYIINVGSVGQPRDNNPRACYVLYDDAAATVTYHRVSYRIKAAQNAIKSVPELDPFFAERLANGR